MKNSNKIGIFTILSVLLVISLSPVGYAEVSTSTFFTQQSDIKVDQSEGVLYLSLIWHQHQPYYKNPSNGIYELPWVYMHSTNSYPFMADFHKNNSDVKATINLTPSLMLQSDEYASGNAYDRRIEIAKLLEADMSDENKSTVVQFFFDINPQFVTGRYQYIRDQMDSYPTIEQKVANVEDGELLDLKVMFFLRWINMAYIEADATLSSLNAKVDEANPDQDKFTHSDLDYVLNVGQQLVASITQKHKDALAVGNIEITTTPFYHPILPLLVDLETARETPFNSNLELPQNNTQWVDDAQEQLDRGVIASAQRFGVAPQGMWPSEQAISKEVIPLIDNANISWVVSDIDVLRNSLGRDLTLEDKLQMYKISSGDSEVAAVFSDDSSGEIADELSFGYGGRNPESTVQDFINKLRKKYNDLDFSERDDYIVTIALDGDNPWENYRYDIDNDGVDEYTGNLFRQLLYDKIKEAQDDGWLQTITPSEYLEMNELDDLPEIDDLVAGSWKGGELNIWVGEPEENNAWTWTIQAHDYLTTYEGLSPLPGQNLTAAWDAMYAAQGSDWYWWYGLDWNSGQDQNFDNGLRTLLYNVYSNIGFTDEEIKEINPLLLQKAKPVKTVTIPGAISDYTIDGTNATDEWTNSFGSEVFDTTSELEYYQVGVSSDLESLLVQIDLIDNVQRSANDEYISIYFNDPRSHTGWIHPISSEELILSQQLNFAVTYFFANDSLQLFEVEDKAWVKSSVTGSASFDTTLEVEIPFEFFGYEAGDFYQISFYYEKSGQAVLPLNGPISAQVPLGSKQFEIIYEIDDPKGDEFGEYALDASFEPGFGLFDLLNFRVGYDNQNVIFAFKFDQMTNVWGAPAGFSHPIIQVYIDQDRITGSGQIAPDQNPNVLIDEQFAWEQMVRADGWLQYGMDEEFTQFRGVNAFSDSLTNTVFITASFEVVEQPETSWAYSVAIGSNDLQKFRSRNAEPQRWALGGGTDDPYDPNVIDTVVPEGAPTNLLETYSVDDKQFVRLLGVGPEVEYSPNTDTDTDDDTRAGFLNWYFGVSAVLVIPILAKVRNHKK